MSDFCSKFAEKLETIMEKRTYIQPEMAVGAVNLDAFVMLLNSNSAPETAPHRRDPMKSPVMPNDTVKVF